MVPDHRCFKTGVEQPGASLRTVPASRPSPAQPSPDRGPACQDSAVGALTLLPGVFNGRHFPLGASTWYPLWHMPPTWQTATWPGPVYPSAAPSPGTAPARSLWCGGPLCAGPAACHPHGPLLQDSGPLPLGLFVSPACFLQS